jgi:hypothetical protein
LDQAAANVAKIDTSEGVDGSEVSTDLEITGVRSTFLSCADENVLNGPYIIGSTLIVVVGNTFGAVGVDLVVVFISVIAPEGLEAGRREVSTWVLS